MQQRVITIAMFALLVSACAADDAADVSTGAGDPSLNSSSSTAPATPDPTTTSAPASRLIISPDGAERLPDDLLVRCPNGGATFPASALHDIPLLAEAELSAADSIAIAGALDEWLANEEGQFWPQTDWRVLHHTSERSQLVHVSERFDVSFMSFAAAEGSWSWSGASSGGACPLEVTLPPGLGRATWQLDPAAEPLTPASTSIDVLVTEQACASAQPIGDRLVGPDLVMTADAALLAFAVTPLDGGQECPGNPELAVTVELAEPLGDREVRDGLALNADLVDFIPAG